MHALCTALKFIERCDNNKFIIFTDSRSCLMAIESQKVTHPLTQKFLELYHTHIQEENEIILCWIPSHIGIQGNEIADRLAKEALLTPQYDDTIPYSDLKMYVQLYTRKLWQRQWNEEIDNKLHSIKPILGENQESNSTFRKDESVWSRIRIGHTHLTQSHILKGENQPLCNYCNCTLTVKHILLDCTHYNITRYRYYHNIQSMKELFDTVSPKKILRFLYDCGLYYKL